MAISIGSMVQVKRLECISPEWRGRRGTVVEVFEHANAYTAYTVVIDGCKLYLFSNEVWEVR